MNKYRNYSEEWLENSNAYGEHVSAMTGEKLHSKSDIAAELAWRDDQLAKANERVAELDKKNNEYAICIIAICDRADIQDYLKNNPTYENASAQLNKFAIEKKVEGVNWFSENYCDDEHSFLADKAIEQLRKEQEHG